MICIDCDTEMTGWPVCLATRSAVRCRVPVSSEGIVWSGIRWTAARWMRVMSLSMTIAPSILASSRRPVAVNGTSRVKPPVEMDSTTLSSPRTIRAPVRPRRMRSSPSRRGVPGAIEARVARSLSCSSMRSATGPPRALSSGAPVRHRVKCRGGRARSTDRFQLRGLDRGRATPARQRGGVRSRVSRAPRTSSTSTTRRPSTTRREGIPRSLGKRPSAGDDRHLEAEPRRLGDALRQVAHPAQLAGEADLPDGHGAPRRRHAEVGAGHGDRDGQVGRGVVQLGAADGRDEGVAAGDAQPGVALEDGEHHVDARRLHARDRAAGALERGRRQQRLHLGQQRSASLHRHGHAGAGDVLGVVLDEEPGRVGDGGDALGGEVEAAHLVDRAVAVLHGTDHPEAGVAVALEVEDHVDEVLEHPRAGDRPVLGDVADDHGGDVAGLGDADQRGGDLLDLGDATGDAVDARGADRLDRVDDQQRRSYVLDVGEHRPEVGLRGEEQLVVDAAGAVGAQPHLGGRLLAGDVEGALPGARGLRGHLEQQRALADARLAGQQDRGARHEPAAEDAVELGHAAGARDRLRGRDLPDGHRRRRDRTGGGAQGRRARLGDGPPGLALAAAADPLGGLPPALRAAVGGAHPSGLRRHGPHARRAHRHPGARRARRCLTRRVGVRERGPGLMLTSIGSI